MLIDKTLQESLKNTSNVRFGYLFGSYADGSAKVHSDVDVALYLDEIDLNSQLDISFKLSKLLKKDVDLVLLNNIKNLYLLDEILQKGILVKDDNLRIDFELKKHHQIIDYKEFKKSIYAA